MSIDRMDWHYGANYPQDLPTENGGTHIGMYLAWIINNNLVGQFHLDEDASQLQAVRTREMTGREFLIRMCDEKFWDEDLNEEGLKFTLSYYGDENSGYFADYESALAADLPTLYHVKDNWENYDRIAPLISKAYERWKSLQAD